MSRTAKILLIILSIALLSAVAVYVLHGGKGNGDKPDDEPVTVSVSIPPLKYLVDRITGNSLAVNVILPPGSSPETYEPTPRSLKSVENSSVTFITGLTDFENTIVRRAARRSSVVRLVTDEMRLIDGHEHHHHSGHTHSHSHGVDPHIWVSPAYLKIMAGEVYNSLSYEFQNDSFADNYHRLLEELDELDIYIRDAIQSSGARAFMIYHPALSYYARDYGLLQIQLENDGKESSAEKLRETLRLAHRYGIDKILYQKEFSVKTVETVADDLGAVPVAIDPLDEDILTNIRKITRIITGHDR